MTAKLTAPALDPDSVPATIGTDYPAPFKGAVGARAKRALGDALGLTDFGVNLVHLPPGAWSSQRHWHSHEDEFAYVIAGELTLITDAGAQTLGPGEAAGFPAGRADGHHLVNRGETAAVYLEVGSRRTGADVVDYPDIDLRLGTDMVFRKRDGPAY